MPRSSIMTIERSQTFYDVISSLEPFSEIEKTLRTQLYPYERPFVIKKEKIAPHRKSNVLRKKKENQPVSQSSTRYSITRHFCTILCTKQQQSTKTRRYLIRTIILNNKKKKNTKQNFLKPIEPVLMIILSRGPRARTDVVGVLCTILLRYYYYYYYCRFITEGTRPRLRRNNNNNNIPIAGLSDKWRQWRRWRGAEPSVAAAAGRVVVLYGRASNRYIVRRVCVCIVNP